MTGIVFPQAGRLTPHEPYPRRPAEQPPPPKLTAEESARLIALSFKP
jgi:hypothetical protein